MTDWKDDEEFDRLLDEACDLAGRYSDLSRTLTEAFEARYGKHAEQIMTDDSVTDAVVYGTGGMCAEDADKLMAECVEAEK